MGEDNPPEERHIRSYADLHMRSYADSAWLRCQVIDEVEEWRPDAEVVGWIAGCTCGWRAASWGPGAHVEAGLGVSVRLYEQLSRKPMSGSGSRSGSFGLGSSQYSRGSPTAAGTASAASRAGDPRSVK